MYMKRSILAFGMVLGLLCASCGGGSGSGSGSGGGGGLPTGTDGGAVSAALYDYVLTRLNALRQADNGALPLFVRDAALDAYAQSGTAMLMTTGVPHGQFAMGAPACPAAIAPTFFAPPPGYAFAGCAGSVRENQGFAGPGGATMANIDTILNAFMAEKPFSPCNNGGVSGHYDAIVDPVMNTIGIGLTQSTAGNLYITIDFCD